MRIDRIEARVEPERVIAEHSETVVPADFFDTLLAALDEQRAVPALRQARTRVRRAVRHD